VTLTGPKVIYRGSDGGEIILTAATGQLDRKSRNVSLEGGVRIQFKDMVFEAAHMTYSHETLSAQTESGVSLKGDSLFLTGRGLKVLVESEEIMIQDDVSARLFNVKWAEPGRKLPM
jgi:LPS export ABC transporter protein LptC